MENALRLVFENEQGKVVRTFASRDSEKPLHVIQREQTKRLELVSDLEALTTKKIKFKELGQLRTYDLEKGAFEIAGIGRLKLVREINEVQLDQKLPAEDSKRRTIYTLVGVTLLFFLMIFLSTLQVDVQRLEQDLKQTVVQIAKTITPRTKPTTQANLPDQMNKPQVVKSGGVKRLGALAALGSLSSGKQKGGIDLGAAQTSAGIGMGGSQGSGGVQTTIYSKGLTSAPLGVGGNLQGAGGYGTKGKGGGQAGYGTMSLVGSAQGVSVPLTNEATIEGGLDRDMIAAVINKNMGQIRFCYEQGLQGSPGLNGRVALDFTIGGQGVVKVAGIANSTLGSKMVEDCILMRLRSWKFPVPQGGVDVKVSYPLVLRRSGQG